MSISTANGPSPQDFYWAKASDIPPAQVLSQTGNTVSLSGGGGSVNVASTTSVASSAQKTTAITYDTGLLETNVAGVLNVGLGSAIGSTRVEGAKIVIQRDPGEPQIEFVKGVAVERIKFDGTKLLMGNVDIQRAVTSSNPTLKLTNTDTSISASLDYDSFSVNLRAPDVPIFLQYLNGLGTSTNSLIVGANTIDVNISDGVTGSVCKFGTGSMTIESDFGVGAPALSLIDTSTGNGGSIEFGINTLNIGNNTGDVSIYAPTGVISLIGGQKVNTFFQSSANYAPVAGDYAICMENAAGRILTLPLIDANTVGTQFLVLNQSTAGTMDVLAVGGQTIYSSTGASSANPRVLPIGHCHTFTALQVSAFPSIVYGWAMI
jgi:hypothetical protein